MAWRIDTAVVHGEIDNRDEGVTRGRIWLAGRVEPIVLLLDGDCWRDLAGAVLRFRNPLPEPNEDAAALDENQAGIVGDMTASRKVKVPSEDGEPISAMGEFPCVWKNTLFLEWFSTINGRVVVEAMDFEMEITDRMWEMDEDAEAAQKLANLHAMRDFMAQVIRRREPDETPVSDPADMDEFEWEERLKESDRLTDAYQEVLEKYMDESDSERKEAFVMGWDGLLDEMAERGEKDSAREEAAIFDVEDDDEEEEYADDDEDAHPLQIKARELTLRAMDVIRQDAESDSPGCRVISLLLQVSGKLAGVLNGRESGYEPEAGFVLAILKRCLSWLNEAVGSCQELMAAEEDPDQLAALAHIRSTAFEIRDAITEMRRELK